MDFQHAPSVQGTFCNTPCRNHLGAPHAGVGIKVTAGDNGVFRQAAVTDNLDTTADYIITVLTAIVKNGSSGHSAILNNLGATDAALRTATGAGSNSYACSLTCDKLRTRQRAARGRAARLNGLRAREDTARRGHLFAAVFDGGARRHGAISSAARRVTADDLGTPLIDVCIEGGPAINQLHGALAGSGRQHCPRCRTFLTQLQCPVGNGIATDGGTVGKPHSTAT